MKITGEHPFRGMISIKLLRNFIKIVLRHGCSTVNWLRIFRTTCYRNISRGFPLEIYYEKDTQKYDYHFLYQKQNSLETVIENYSTYTTKLFYTCG